MNPFRRLLGAALLAALAALTSFALGSCGKNDILGQGYGRLIVPKGAGPIGQFSDPASAPWKWAVNSIDSVVFNDDIDSTTLQVTGFELLDVHGHLVPGTTRFVPGNAYIHYTQDFPSPAYAFYVKDSTSTFGASMSKVYFIPDRPLSGHRTYVYVLTTGVRMISGKLKRDGWAWSFTTGDSTAPARPN